MSLEPNLEALERLLERLGQLLERLGRLLDANLRFQLLSKRHLDVLQAPLGFHLAL